MALSDKRIVEAMHEGSVVIEPFVKKNLATSSYDVTLGEWYFTEEPPKHFENIFNPYDKHHVDRVWGTKARRAEYAKDVFEKYKFDWKGIHPKERVILLAPGETILAHTEEFIGGKDHITTMMKARSSLGRSFISVCKCAGWGDVGYINRWTMEIQNTSARYYIPLVVGRRIAQIVFFETGPIAGSDYASEGKYQSPKNLTDLQRAWNPAMMLPRLHIDRDIAAGAKRARKKS
jgi:dCTP deaminase